MSIAIELHSSFLQKTHRFFKIVNIKIPLYRFVPYLHPENSNGRCSGTILTGNTCVTVPVIGGGDNAYWTLINVANSKQANIILIRLAESMFYLSFKINA